MWSATVKSHLFDYPLWVHHAHCPLPIGLVASLKPWKLKKKIWCLELVELMFNGARKLVESVVEINHDKV
jgi:hypothetical protein